MLAQRRRRLSSLTQNWPDVSCLLGYKGNQSRLGEHAMPQITGSCNYKRSLTPYPTTVVCTSHTDQHSNFVLNRLYPV